MSQFQPYRRNTDERFERTMYLRDMRVNGNVYKGNVSSISLDSDDQLFTVSLILGS